MDLQHWTFGLAVVQAVGIGSRDGIHFDGRQLLAWAGNGGAERAAIGGGCARIKRRDTTDERVEVGGEYAAERQVAQQFEPALHDARQRILLGLEELPHVADEPLLWLAARREGVVHQLRRLVQFCRRRPLRAKQCLHQLVHVGRYRTLVVCGLSDLEEQLLPAWKPGWRAEASADKGYHAAGTQLFDEVGRDALAHRTRYARAQFTSGGVIMGCEEPENAVWHELIAATHFMLEKRRNRNAYFAAPLAHDATDAYRDARALAQTVATGLRILALAETEWIQIHYNNWLPEDGKSPIDKWTAAWIETGAAEVTQGGSVRLLLPATLGDIPGAETQTPDIRDQPGGDALFQFWMEKRRREDERLGRDRDRVGGGGRDGVGNGAPHARSQLQLSSLATS